MGREQEKVDSAGPSPLQEVFSYEKENHVEGTAL